MSAQAGRRTLGASEAGRVRKALAAVLLSLFATGAWALELQAHRGGRGLWPENMLAEIERAGLARRVTLQSFDWRTLALAGELMPALPRAYLTSARGTLRDHRWTAGLDPADFASTPRLVKAAAGVGDGTVTWSPAAGDVTAADVREAHALGLSVVPWTVNDRAAMAHLIDLGVDGLITDRPDVLREVMRDRGLPVPAGHAPTSANRSALR